MWSPFRSRCNGAAEPLRLHMKHGVSDATIYPLRMLASAILRGLKQFFFSYGCVSGFRGHQNPSVESRTEQRTRPRRSWRDQRNNASRGTAGAAGRGDVMNRIAESRGSEKLRPGENIPLLSARIVVQNPGGKRPPVLGFSWLGAKSENGFG
jgi:hypothetical protein